MVKRKPIIITPEEEYAYGYIIKALAGGLYPNKFDVIREYVQNSFDAIVNWKKITGSSAASIRLTIQKPSIFIYDNGTGMDRHTLNEYRKVGFSKKMIGEFAGFRGIGKLAGISIAQQLVVTTSPSGLKEKYILVFDAESMIKKVDELKKNKENISLNDLIKQYTNLTSASEAKDEHYTLIELHNIKKDSKILFEKKKLTDYLSLNTPVPFHPDFEYGEKIEEDIVRFVPDYNSVTMSVDGDNIYKPFSSGLKSHQHILVYKSKNKNKLFAFCWYCENKKKGQIRPLEKSGLIYRYKNFAVGDNYLTRKTIWNTSSHLAFYFIGEVYIVDEAIIPTSQRDNFEQNAARDKFYDNAQVIANELNRLARESSGIRRAREHIEMGYLITENIKTAIAKKEYYIRDLSVEKIAQLVNVIDNIEKREDDIPDDDKQTKNAAAKIIREANKILDDFKSRGKIGKEYDIVKQLNLNSQAALVYKTAIRTLKDFLIDKAKDLENIVRTFQKNLEDVFKKRR